MPFIARLVISLSCFICFSFQCVGQSNAWQSLTISDGLSQGMVNDMIQDRQGFMWFATKDGLNRYDGYNFKIFTRDADNPYSISGNFCTALLEDTKGRIWIGTEKDGLNLYDPKTHRFTHIAVFDTQKKREGNYGIDYLKEDAKGRVWIITRQPGTYFVISQAGARAIEEGKGSEMERVTITGIGEMPDFVSDRHALEVGHARSMYRFDAAFYAQEKMLSELTFVMKDREGYYWGTGLGEILCWRGNTFKKVAVPRQFVPRLGILRDGSVWVCYGGNVWLFKNMSELTSSALLPGKAVNGFLASDNPASVYGPVNNLYLDRERNIWASNQGYGLIKANRYTRFFRSYLPLVSPGLLYQSREGKVFFHGNYRPTYHFFALNKSENMLERLPNLLYGKNRQHEALVQDKNRDFWLIIWNGQQLVLERYSPEWQLIQKIPLPDLGMRHQRNARLMEDSRGNLWIGLVNGTLLKLNRQTGQFVAFDFNSLLPQTGGRVETLALYEDTANSLWVGTQAGLIKAKDLDSIPSFSRYCNVNKDQESLSENVVSGMVDDPLQPHRYLWVSTKGGGLERLDKQSGSFEHFNESRGLPNRVVYGVLAGQDGNLWMSTNRGIARLNPKSLAFTNFDKSDGLQDDEFNTASYFNADTGELLFGGVKGITVFYPSDMKEEQKEPVVKIMGLKINNHTITPGKESKVLKESIEYVSELDLEFDQNQVSIEFALMDFTNPAKNRFRYQMQGIDREWVEVGTDHLANFAQIPYGQYTFRVQGTANGEVWSKPVILKIRIHPPLYLRWWAYLFYILLGGYGFYRFYRNQMKRALLEKQIRFKERETARLAELDELKTNFFTSISHEFRTPLTLIAGPVDDLRKKYPQESVLPVIQRNTTRLLTLINQLLDLGKLEAREMQLDPQPGDLATFLRYLGGSFQSYAESLSIYFSFDQNRQHYPTVFDADKIEKIFTNLLSNAFKFTGSQGRVDLRVSYSTSGVDVVLSDTGVGIAPEKLSKIFERFYQVDNSVKRSYEGTGIGLALVKELVDLLQGTIRVESQEGVGTVFCLYLPLREQEGLGLESESGGEYALEPWLPGEGEAPTGVEERKSYADQNDNILLVVDDNRDLRTYLRSIFEKTYQVLEASNGQEGLDLALKVIPDVVISDLMMPIMDGFEFCHALKTNQRTSHIPMVLLTAKATLEDRMEGLETGADDYLVKPFNAMEVTTRVRNLIASREQLKKFYTQSMLTSQPISSELSTLEAPFIKNVKQIVERAYNNSRFDVEQLAKEMNMSSSQLLRKLKALTNLTTVEFIREYRLQKAAELLTQKSMSVSEVAYQTGFESLSYFTKVFQQKYDRLPSDYP
ncbi:ATP-binding protein [Dyadobacter sp. LHD-138]|uniref:hybrid sensor histidine kinase/response regulator transcription factor n=1 Tax=Dyadobacter sp. LHD-138 TaxID=3071413 RepID=UPI0027E074D4|nr:ATP-binding protein [Dyadobacter sp. LHD-138]MDQ6477217.1 ATP-binding protein [Dyadobacter sp. LHD-138]